MIFNNKTPVYHIILHKAQQYFSNFYQCTSETRSRGIKRTRRQMTRVGLFSGKVITISHDITLYHV